MLGDKKSKNLKDELILAGINEINTHGVSAFSIRRVASECGVSCAAPYRDFKDKNGLIAAIIDYVNEKWAARQEEILQSCGNSLREQIIEISLGYIRFLMEKPYFRSVLMLKDEEFDNLYHKKRTQFGSLSQTLEHQLFEASGFSEDVWKRKVLVFRTFIFGSLFLFDAGEFEYNETTMEYIRYTLNREFDVL